MKKSYLIIAACAVGAFVLLRQSKTAATTTGTGAGTSAPASGMSSALAALLGGLKGSTPTVGSSGTVSSNKMPYGVSDGSAASPAPAPSTAGRVAVVGGSMPGLASAGAAAQAAMTGGSGWGNLSTQPTVDNTPVWYDNTKTFQPGMLIHA